MGGNAKNMKKCLYAALIMAIAVSFTASLAFAANSVHSNPDRLTLTHQSATVNGVVLHYVMAGKGEPVVLLHGWPETWYMWRHVMPALAGNYTVIAPDLRGFGNSSRPITGYGGKIAAEDIYQLVKQLGYKECFLVGHDIGAQVAYSYAAAHPEAVKKLVIMEYIFPGFYPTGFEGGLWWFSFHNVRDLPESLVEGKERTYLTWFYKGLAYNPSAINEEDISEYVTQYSAPGGMRAGFEYYRAFAADAIENQGYAKTKLQMPVLVLGGEFYPMLGGRIFNPAIPSTHPAAQSTQMLAQNVRVSVIRNSGHWLAEENPEQVARELSLFFGERK